MRTIRIEVEYEGGGYCGWQVQPNGPTVQGALEEAVEKLTGAFSRVEGAGRTDAGVHAVSQTAHFKTASAMPGEDFARALNAHLPRDIAVRKSSEAPEAFHARFSAIGKEYLYRIENSPTRPVLCRRNAWWISWPLCDALLRQGAEAVVGRHDFTSFADADRAGEENVRTVYEAQWVRDGRQLLFRVRGNGFLYKMVRVIVGTLVEVGRGKVPPEEMRRILAARDRRAAGPTAPPHGLHLVSVEYPPDGSDGEGA